ncbi:MAG: DUF4956 domain-containing protein [Thermodesulfobacteriota bacterium]
MDKTELMKILGSFSNPKMTEIGFTPFLIMLLISLLSAFFISFLYALFSSASTTGSRIHRSFPLLGISITAIFICIQFSLPLSLGLLGALSIVRFRTPVKEPEEIGFIMLIIASSISCAIFNMVFLAIILGVAIVAVGLMKIFRDLLTGKSGAGMLIIKMPTIEYEKANASVFDLIRNGAGKVKIDGITTQDSNTSISCSFSKMKPDAFIDFQNQIKKISEKTNLNLFYHHPGN